MASQRMGNKFGYSTRLLLQTPFGRQLPLEGAFLFFVCQGFFLDIAHAIAYNSLCQGVCLGK